jgi:hypothetical protein
LLQRFGSTNLKQPKAETLTEWMAKLVKAAAPLWDTHLLEYELVRKIVNDTNIDWQRRARTAHLKMRELACV